MNSSDTICALATAPGGALGIIRVSGPDAFSIVSSLCSVRCDLVAANTVHYTHIMTPLPSEGSGDGGQSPLPSEGAGEALDECMVAVFRAPHSYTGEDSVEISCHGSRYILNKVLELLVQHGCRMARPGEFTQRAYLNGKLDLSQAEAVADLIASTNAATHRLAMSQLRGGISSELASLRDQLLRLTSLLELELDFSDHEDLEFADRTELLVLAKTIDAHISRLARSFETGQAIKQGIPVAIVGKTNVGKSTLLNALLGDDRAIVSDIHGTTRDTIEDTIDIRGVTFRFIDTAGIRQTTDKVEQIGIDRTYQAISRARIVLWLIDDDLTPTDFPDMQARCAGKPLLLVCTKADLLARNKADLLACNNNNLIPSPVNCATSAVLLPSLSISAKTGQGLPALKSAIYAAADIPKINDSDAIVTNARHYDALTSAHTQLQRVLEGLSPLTSHLSPLSSDLLAEDLRLVLDTLAEITGGAITPQETLNSIFSSFCVGK